MRGGRRPGAGRPTINEREKRVSLVLSVSQQSKAWMQSQSKEQGVPMGVILEVLIDSFEQNSETL